MWWKQRKLEARRNERFHVLMDGTIIYDPDGREQNCIIANISRGGAMVMLDEGSPIPATGILVVVNESCRAPFRVIWKAGTRLGLQFLNERQRQARKVHYLFGAKAE